MRGGGGARAGGAGSLARSGRAEQALPLLEEAAPALAAQLGAEDPHAAYAQEALADTRRELAARQRLPAMVASA